MDSHGSSLIRSSSCDPHKLCCREDDEDEQKPVVQKAHCIKIENVLESGEDLSSGAAGGLSVGNVGNGKEPRSSKSVDRKTRQIRHGQRRQSAPIDPLQEQIRRNIALAQKLSPISKYKEMLKKTRSKASQRRKFSLINGLTMDGKRNTSYTGMDTTHMHMPQHLSYVSPSFPSDLSIQYPGDAPIYQDLSADPVLQQQFNQPLYTDVTTAFQPAMMIPES